MSSVATQLIACEGGTAIEHGIFSHSGHFLMTTLHNLLLLFGKPKSNFKDSKQMVISNGDQRAYLQE